MVTVPPPPTSSLPAPQLTEVVSVSVFLSWVIGVEWTTVVPPRTGPGSPWSALVALRRPFGRGHSLIALLAGVTLIALLAGVALVALLAGGSPWSA